MANRTRVWGQPLDGEYRAAWASAAFIATVTGRAAHYRGPYGLSCAALPVQEVYRNQGLREAVRQARWAGTAAFLPVVVQALMGMQDELRALVARVRGWFL